MNFLMRKIIDVLSKRVNSFYPQPEYPVKNSDWDIGHLVLQTYMEYQPKWLLPTWLDFVQYQAKVGIRPPLSETEKKWIRWGADIGDGQITRFRRRGKKENMLEFNYVVPYRAASCGSLAQFAKHLLMRAKELISKDFKLSCYIVNLNILENGKILENDHNFCLYTKPGTPQLTFEEMMRDVTNPNVRILDLWTASCGPVPEVLNHFANIFAVNRDGKWSPVLPKMDFVLEEWWIKEDPKETKKFWWLGTTCERFNFGSREKFVCINKKPECYEKIQPNCAEKPRVVQAHSVFKKCATWRRVPASWENKGRGDRTQ